MILATALRPSLLALAMLVLLTACGGAPPQQQDPEPAGLIEGTVDNVADMPLPVNVTLFTARASAFITSAAAGGPGAPTIHEYLGELLDLATTVVSPSGAFRLELPEVSEIPGAYLVPAVSIIQPTPYTADASCSLTASGPATVLRMWMPPSSILAYPVIVAGPITPDTSRFIGLVVYTDGDPMVTPTSSTRGRSWTHASAAVEVQGVCEIDDGVDPVVTYAVVDLSLEPGWNEVTLVYDPDEDLTTVTAEPFAGQWVFVDAAP